MGIEDITGEARALEKRHDEGFERVYGRSGVTVFALPTLVPRIPSDAAHAMPDPTAIEAALESGRPIAELARLCGGREPALRAFAAHQERRYPSTSEPGPACALCQRMIDPPKEQMFLWDAQVQRLQTFWLTVSTLLVSLSHARTNEAVPTEHVFMRTHHAICGRCASRCAAQRRRSTWLRRTCSVGASIAGFLAVFALAPVIPMALEPGPPPWGFVWFGGWALLATAAFALGLWRARRLAVPRQLRAVGRAPFQLFRIVPLERLADGSE